MLDIQDRIFEAIVEYVENSNNVQSKIFLPRRDYDLLHKQARSTVLGRIFSSGGLFFCTLEVFKVCNLKEIVIA